jgi:porphobilinogen synthase
MRRPRRNRKSETIRALVREHQVNVNDLVFPLFVTDGKNIRHEVSSMPGIFRLSKDLIVEEVGACMALGLKTFMLFPHISESLKDSMATESYNPNSTYIQTIRAIKSSHPECCLITDVAMDPYSSDGHDGIVQDGEILNDETLEVLGKMAIAQAVAGADIVGPSDMMDGRVGYLRDELDQHGFERVSIMSYTAKYASAFYGPFRDALDSAPKAGDKKTYQMDPANSTEALLEGELDFAEGADMLMVKPAGAYLDIIKMLYDEFELPIVAYQVSGEYAMIKAAALKGWLDNNKVRDESLLAIKRAGAKIIITYFAKEFAENQNFRVS